MSGVNRNTSSSVPFPRSAYGQIYSPSQIQYWRTQNLNAALRPTINVTSTTNASTTSNSSQPRAKRASIKIPIETIQPSTTYMRLARYYKIEKSLFERSILNDVYSRQRSVLQSTNHVYPPIGDAFEELPAVRGIVDNLYIFKNQHVMSEDDSWSYTAQLTLQLANYLIQQDYKPDDVIILTAFSGQLVYMENERNLYANISKVKMAVLEDFSGEETRIILVSLPLVKTNFLEETKFLTMENKIIMAISKAKEGFYMFGDMELLKSKSIIWSQIETILTKKGSIGHGLKLKCANHGSQITMIKDMTDFTKVPEGGCLRECKFQLPCGHICPRTCHAYDITHSNFKCEKPCERKICEIDYHKCLLPCSAECQPCRRPLMKHLPCGHRKEVPCHYEVGDPRIICTSIVDVTLPGCGHKTSKPCSMEYCEVMCTEKCENSRLDCGHTCVRTCHVNDDPDHENYTCKKPCPKPKRGCTAHLDGDLGVHQCPKLCYEDCPDCNVEVIKLSLKTSACRHPRKVPCHIKADQVSCKEKCDRPLPCGHPCNKLCYEPCGDCQVIVKKKVAGCQHDIEVACSVQPTPAQCRSKCVRTLDCGHECPGRCNQPCNSVPCNKIMDRNFDSPCGHKVKLPCHELNAILTGGLNPELLPQHCTAACGAVLRCGHQCGGSCSACRRGRLHVPCAVTCDRLNICGHRCMETCHEHCPPCTERCQLKCQHSACSEPCGAPCIPCAEPECCRGCEHTQCLLACGAPCDAAPCARACTKLQACGHLCRGVCGEPCPTACYICDPEGFPVDLTGQSYDDDDVRFIQLQDCHHILDVETLDGYMNSTSENIQFKGCPFCRKPIINTYRYKDIINRMVKDDINPAKERKYGTLSQRQRENKELVVKVQRINLNVNQKLALAHTSWKPAFNVIETALEDKTISLHYLRKYHTHLDLLKDAAEYYMKYRNWRLQTFNTEKEELLSIICDVLVTNQTLSEQQLEDVRRELKRFNSLIKLAVILEHSKFQSSKSNSKTAEAAANAKEAVLNSCKFDELKAVECLQKLQDAVNISRIGTKGSWYKCKNCSNITLNDGICIDCFSRT